MARRLNDLFKRVQRRRGPGLADLSDLKKRLGIEEAEPHEALLSYPMAVASRFAAAAGTLRDKVDTMDPLDGLVEVGRAKALAGIIRSQEGEAKAEEILTILGVDLKGLQRRLEERLVEEMTDLVTNSLSGGE